MARNNTWSDSYCFFSYETDEADIGNNMHF